MVIFGTGGLAQEVIGYLRHYSPHINIEGVVSRDPKEIGKHFQDVLVVGAENEDGAYWLSSRPEEGVIAIGNPEIRYKIANRIRMNWSTLIFAQDLVLVNNRIHEGVVICPGVRLTSGVEIKPHVFVNLSCTIGHNAVIGEYSVINPQASISGEVQIGPRVLVGTNATILEGRKIGEGAVIGAGAVVTEDVQPHTVVVGVPAKFIKKREESDVEEI